MLTSKEKEMNRVQRHNTVSKLLKQYEESDMLKKEIKLAFDAYNAGYRHGIKAVTRNAKLMELMSEQ